MGREPSIASLIDALCSCMRPSYLVPDLHSERTLPAVVRRFEAVAARTEMFTDRPEGRQEALGVASRLEALHGSFAFAGGLVRVGPAGTPRGC